MSSSCVILMYHVVDEPRSRGEARFCCRPRDFAEQMAYLAVGGWSVISLTSLVGTLARGEPPPSRSVVITFDDGTACTHEQAMPVLARHGFPATVFVVSGRVGGHNEWMTRDGHPERRILDIAQMKELDHARIEIGSHTVGHVRLAGLDPQRQRHEIADSRRQLEDALGKPVHHFAYPYGSHDASAKAAVRAAGYASACSTLQGRNRAGADLTALHRTEVRGTDSLLQFALKLRLGTHDMPPWSFVRAQARGWMSRFGVAHGRQAGPSVGR